MLQRIITSFCLLIGFVFSGFSQYVITGSNPAWEGSTEKYIFPYSGRMPVGLQFSFTVSNGVVLAANTDPYHGEPLSIKVKWNCSVNKGNITIAESVSGTSYTYSVSVLTFGTAPSFCSQIDPQMQAVNFAQVPNPISVIDCSPFCANSYDFQYQWQIGDIIPGATIQEPSTWTDINGATNAIYTPIAFSNYGIKAYRRRTSFYFNGSLQQLYSSTAIVSFLNHLKGGTLFGGGTINNIQQPYLTQTAATGGLCVTSDYNYTWERSVDNGPWEVIGNGIEYPSGIPVLSNTRIRRKVTCASEEAYSNIVSFTLQYISANIENLNYIRTTTLVVPGVISLAQADNLPTGKKIQRTAYYDGFGRMIQQVSTQTSLKETATDPNEANNYQDLVKMIKYDGLGRVERYYNEFASTSGIATFRQNAENEQQQFTNTISGEPSTNPYTYSTLTFDGSPAYKTVNAKVPGWEWNKSSSAYQGLGSAIEVYRQTEQVHIWSIGYERGAIPLSSPEAIYPDGSLLKNVLKDDRGKLMIEYKDISGKVVLKKVQEKETGTGLDVNGHSGWLCTYYVYDDFKRLRYIITPKAVEILNSAATNWTITASLKEGLCFYYEYDEYGRIITKHAPGSGEIYLIYDNRDRLVLTQNENQRHQQPVRQWSFSLYDEFDRVVATGLLNDNRSRDGAGGMTQFAKSLNRENTTVELFTGILPYEQFRVYNPVAGQIPNASGGQYCSSCSGVTVNTISYYDGYSASSKPFEVMSTAQFAPTDNPYIEPFLPTKRLLGMATGGRVRILNEKYNNGIITDDEFLSSTVYYNSQGNVLQTFSDNIRKGADVTSIQYDFSGKILSTANRHQSPNSVFNDLITVSKADFDLLGRAIKTYKLYTKNTADISDRSKYKLLSHFSFDPLGRLRTKKIGTNPDNPSRPLEIQDFSYNIQNWLTGINKDYALAQYAGNPDYGQWERHFGFYLGYEKGEGRFTAPRYNSDLSGVIWRSQGDNTPRKYNFNYDNVGRLVKADFLQMDVMGSGTWDNALADFSSRVDSYDANGNIVQLKQSGIMPGISGGILIDDLRYDYYEHSNRLKSVTEPNPNTSVNGKLGDFKDYNSGIDYDYDFNGNLLYDKNKAIIDNAATISDVNPAPGIVSNYLNLPQTIQVKGKSKTDYTYDAAGNRLAKKVTDMVTGSVTTTSFAGKFIYEDNDLKYILNEEGRLRIIEPIDKWSGPSGTVNYLQRKGNIPLISTGTIQKWGVWDYFIKDHLGNLRMVLTEESWKQTMVCSMENISGTSPNPATEEEVTFGQQTDNEVISTRADVPTGWSQNRSLKVSKLLSIPGVIPQKSIGPNVILKVMAGDILSATAKYFYENPNGTPVQNESILTNLVSSLFGTFQNGTVQGLVKENSGLLFNNFQNIATSPLTAFFSNRPDVLNTTPRAYLNYIFFDEQFRYVSTGSGAVPVAEIKRGNSIEGVLPFSTTVPKNGYVYVYLSNDSRNIPVYFDDFVVNHKRGAIIEDNAFYPHGLKINGISSRAALIPKSKLGYRAGSSIEDEETGYNEFPMRTYDPQIARWIQADPKVVEAGNYNAVANNPVNKIDPDGADWLILVSGALVFFDGDFEQAFLKYGDALAYDIGNHAILTTKSGKKIYLDEDGKAYDTRPEHWDVLTTVVVNGVRMVPSKKPFLDKAIDDCRDPVSKGSLRAFTNFLQGIAHLVKVANNDTKATAEFWMNTEKAYHAGSEEAGPHSSMWYGLAKLYAKDKARKLSSNNPELISQGLSELGLDIGPFLIGVPELDAVRTGDIIVEIVDIERGTVRVVEVIQQGEKIAQVVKNAKGVEYPKISVAGYGEVPFPEGPYVPNNSTILRPSFTRAYKEAFKEWWISQGHPWPEGNINIHHIKPLSKGGTNDFSNLVPLIQPEEHQPFTNWWRSFN